MLLNPRAGPSFQRKFCTGPAISPFSIRNSAVARHAGVEQRLRVDDADVPEERDQQPAPRRLDHLVDRLIAAVHHQAHARRRRGGRLALLVRPEPVVGEVLDHALLDPGDRPAARPSGPIGVCRSTVLPMSLRIVTLSPNTFCPSFVAPRSAPLMKLRPFFGGARVERLQHQRQEARRRAGLEDDRVGARLDGARLARRQCLGGGGLGDRRRVDRGDVLHPGRARPSRSGAVRCPAGQDQARLGVAVVGEQALGVARASVQCSFGM